MTVNYTLSGIRPGLAYKVAFDVTSRGVTRGVTNAAAKLADGPASQTINVAALFNSPKPDPEAEFAVTLLAVKPKCVQLWEDGPYWAECNLGATSPEEPGYYFWWGDTVGYKRNAANDGWVSVKDGRTIEFSNTDPTATQSYEKDNATLQAEGWIDASEKGRLMPEHDAASVYLGGMWRMPTEDEIYRLVINTTREWVDNYKGTGVSGCLVKGKGSFSENSIFIPESGYGEGSSLLEFGRTGLFWSSTPFTTPFGYYGYYLYSRSDGSYFYLSNYWNRCYGFPVRPVQGFAK